MFIFYNINPAQRSGHLEKRNEIVAGDDDAMGREPACLRMNVDSGVVQCIGSCLKDRQSDA